ncbi:hypothetical protein L2E82_05175 [Cichorium intybus]|uniref:Uncharacterized protein n=1 Tax=Cichorium intybus TaxID=13427 RepID=A0ACB9H6Q1_CICIN|nr:hypothetical protein L2E82_05175 [Cichorium intybus]
MRLFISFLFEICIFPGLNCLQRDYPCNRNTTQPYSSFAIKCGGSGLSSNDIQFDTENSTALGPASYYLFQEKWAVSNGGIVIDRDDPSFIATSRIEVNNTRYPELFRTSRKSPGSLRYYGLGLQDGPYTISLFFAETVFNLSKNTWQGFKVKGSSNKTGMIIGIIAAVGSVCLMILIFGLYMKRRRSKHGEEEEILGMGPKIKTYTYAELKSATADFSRSNLLGEGGFGPVYKGTLSDGTVVAVKQLSVASHHGRKKEKEKNTNLNLNILISYRENGCARRLANTF